MNQDQNDGSTNNQAVSNLVQTQPQIQPVQVAPHLNNENTSTIVGSLHKEVEPVKTEPILTPSEQTPSLEHDVREAGVEAVSEKLKLTKEHEEIGVKHAKEATPVNTESKGIVNLPMPVGRAEEIVKTHKKVTDSILWMAKNVVRQFKKGTIRKEGHDTRS